jgi:2-polyprenyl-3-methyl-5-hydroxy-6-metoxy-1,4-benzoquinol methylase
MNERGKNVDTTYLSIDGAEERGFIHRDYIAHCLRWSHVIKRLGERKNYNTARILDVGCGREMPLAKTLYSSRYIVERYYGIDVGPIPDETLNVFDSGKFPIKVWERTDLCSLTEEDLDSGKANWVTCFEVLEHVEPRHMLAMLAKVQALTTEDAVFFFSTPCWNRVDCAANHVNEMTYEALGAVFEAAGFAIEKVYGTFASIRDYDHLLGVASQSEGVLSLRHTFEKLREYYDSNFLSCVFAPLFPGFSRNCLWELRKQPQSDGVTPGYVHKFKPLSTCQEPWGSSHLWKEMQHDS